MDYCKPKLSINELIVRMKEHGIKFNIVSEDEAKEFLQEHNYYLKVTAYRENYRKNEAGPDAGKYINLEFAYLKELSIIDMYLRYLILDMALDIEHYIKVSLLNHLADNEKDDGYKTVNDFIDFERSNSKEGDYSKALATIDSHKKSSYCKDLINKYSPNFPIWVFLEVVSMSETFSFYDFYLNKYGIKNVLKQHLNSVRDIRNAAAHSNCIINNLTQGNNQPHGHIINDLELQCKGLKVKSVSGKLRNRSLYDLTALLLTYNKVVTSVETKAKMQKRWMDLLDIRMIEHADWFKSNNTITSAYSYIRMLVTSLSW